MGHRKDDGSWHDTCLDKLEHGEPFFVLRAQDIWATVLVRLWATFASITGCPPEKIAEAHETATLMELWSPRKFPD